MFVFDIQTHLLAKRYRTELANQTKPPLLCSPMFALNHLKAAPIDL